MEPLKIPLVRRPTFVVEENGSDYSSMASGDSDAAEKEVGNDDIKDSKQQFKSAFAQELTVKTPKTDIGHHYSSEGLTKSQFDQILDKTLDFRKAQEDYLRVKQENARLRMEIEKQKHEEERYNKLHLEIEYLTGKLSKVTTTLNIRGCCITQLTKHKRMSSMGFIN